MPSLTAAALALGALLASAVPAAAGTYVAHSCRTPAGAAAGTSDWLLDRTSDTSTVTSACPSGPLTLQLKPGTVHAADAQATLDFHAPRDTEIVAYSIHRSVRLGPRYNFWRYEKGVGYVAVERCHTTDGSCSALGDPAQPLGGSNLVRQTGRAGVRNIELKLTCGEDDTHTTTCASANPAGVVNVHSAAITLQDGFLPTFASPPSGPPIDSPAELTGVQPIWVSASDRGGGVFEAALELDGRVVASRVLDGNGGRCQEPFTAAQPCSTSAAGELTLDTTAVPDGPHSLRVLVSDATRTNVTAWGPVQISTANSSCNPSPRVDSMRLSAGFPAKPTPRTVVTRAYGGRLQVSGRLVSPLGVPSVGARVCLLGREDRPDAPLREFAVVVTDANGGFSAPVPAGPSRQLLAVHRVPGGAAVASMRVRVRAAVSLRPSRRRLRNGGTVVLRGRLRHGPLPDRGVLVELQAKRGRKWQTFGTTRTRTGGRYELRYRFTRTTGVQRYAMRALVPDQSAYPYVRGVSRPIALRVRAR
ncbi:MAG TPA: hypothetical protein VLK58_13535 [Conexibacter sp.]|nr:hypothetical protein [Conexibacter sp.]